MLIIYDGDNMQTEVKTTSTGASIAIYEYDGSGKRIKKTVGTTQTIFVYNAIGQLIAEYQTNYQAGNVRTSYLTADQLGSPRVLTDSAGVVQSRHDYMAFGQEIYAGVGGRSSTQKYVDDSIRQQYTGYERDDESGLDYAQARYYSSQHGRFTSVDPLMASATIKNPQTFNRYSYALNSPYKFTDPLGLVATSPSGQGANDPFIPEMNPQHEQAQEQSAQQNQQQQQITSANMGNVTLPEGPTSTPSSSNRPIVKDDGPAPYEGFSTKQIRDAQILRGYIQRSSIGSFVTVYSFNLDVYGKVQVDLTLSDPAAAREALKNDPRFIDAGLGGRHSKELGESGRKNVDDFRSITFGDDRLGPKSLQIDIGKTTGRSRADLDSTNPKQDPGGAFVHGVQLFWHGLKKIFKDK